MNNFINIVALRRTKLPLSYLLSPPHMFLSFCQYRPAAAISVVLVFALLSLLMAHWHPNGRTSEAAYFPPFERRSSPSPICLQVKGAYIYMTSTRFGDFLTPSPIRLQNLYCLSANFGYFHFGKEEPSQSKSHSCSPGNVLARKFKLCSDSAVTLGVTI